jgi:hypothetical protein
MNRTIIVLALSILLVACAGSPARTGWEAERNRENMLGLNVGQSKDQVLIVMGKPYKTESYVIDGKPVEFWLYLTEGKSVHDPRLTDAYFTPLSFENGILKGWGRNYYDNTLRIKKDVTIESK